MSRDDQEGKAFRKKQESRDRIIAAASKLFIERGARSVSMDEVAVEAGVARRTLFNYFASKDDLLWAVASPMLEMASELAEEGLVSEGKVASGLDAVIGLCLELWRRWGRRLSLLYSVDLVDEGRLAALHGTFLARFQRIVSEALTGRAHIIDSQDQVGGYPKIEPVTRVLDVPATQRREWLEKMARAVE